MLANEQKKWFKEDIEYNSYIGVIVDNRDPEYMGRCKIKVFNKFDQLENEEIPWCYPSGYHYFGSQLEKGGGNFSYPKIGAVVKVVFFHGDLYAPEYYSCERLSDNVKKFISKEEEESYKNSQVLILDEDERFRISYKIPEGATFFHKESYMNIRKNTNIDIHHSNTESRIQLNNGMIRHTSIDNIQSHSPTIWENAYGSHITTAPAIYEKASIVSIKASVIFLDAPVVMVSGVIKGVVVPGGGPGPSGRTPSTGTDPTPLELV